MEEQVRARAAALLFNKRRYSKYHGLLAWACLDYLFLEERYEPERRAVAGYALRLFFEKNTSSAPRIIIPR